MATFKVQSSSPSELAEIAAILESQVFERCDTLKKLLGYLWLRRGQEFSEYAIAIEALGRKADFDPKTDASVRVQIARLRQKLKEFYDREGADYSILISIPIGSHSLEVSQRETEPTKDLEELRSPIRNLGPQSQRLVWSLGILCVALMLVSSWLLWKQHLSAHSVPHETEVENFWHTFLGRSEKTLIVLPTPVFLTYAGLDGLHVRDSHVNDFADWATSPELAGWGKAYGAPSLDQSYTVTSDTFASIALARYLDAAGMGENITFVDSAGAPIDALEHDNEVAFGTHFTLRPFQAVLDSMTFAMAVGELYVGNRKPAPKEPASFPLLKENDQRKVEPCIIAVLPGKTPRTHLLILQGSHTSALVRFLTSSSGISALRKMWKAHGAPSYYETVVYAEMNGNDLLSAWPVAMHAYAYSAK